MLLGVVGAVFGLSKIHAVAHGYVFHGSFRFGWAIAYTALLWIAAYAVGIPDLARRRNVWVFAVAAASIGALAISAVQLVVGSALLPRVVVFGAAIVLVPWYVLCCLVAAGGRLRAEARDRVIVVGAVHEDEMLRAELEESAEQPAQVIASLLVSDAAGSDDGSEPLVDRAIADQASVVVLSRTAQDDDRIVEQAAVLHEAGVRVRSLADFYEQWLGKLPIGELERVSLMFDIREVHREQYARLKRLLDVVLGSAALVVLGVSVPLVLVGNLVSNRGSLFYRQERVGRDGRRFSILKYRTMVGLSRRHHAERVDDGRRPAHHAVRSRAAAAARRRAAPGVEHPAR